MAPATVAVAPAAALVMAVRAAVAFGAAAPRNAFYAQDGAISPQYEWQGGVHFCARTRSKMRQGRA